MMTLGQKVEGRRQKAKAQAWGRGLGRFSACLLAAMLASAQAWVTPPQSAAPAAETLNAEALAETAAQLSGLLPQPVPLEHALDTAVVAAGGVYRPEGTAPALGLRGVRLYTGTLGAEASGFGLGGRYTQTFSLPLLGYAEAGAEGQLRWNGGWRVASDARLGAGPLELTLTGERFTTPLALLLPLEALADPRPDARAEGWNAALSARYRVGEGTVLLLGKTWGGQPRSRLGVELRPQLWAVDGERVGFGLGNPSDTNPDIWAESLGTLTLRAGGEWGAVQEGVEGAGLRVGAGWQAAGGLGLEAAAVLGTHTELSMRVTAYDLWREGSEWRVGVVVSDAWLPEAGAEQGGWPVQVRGAVLLPVGAEGWTLEAEATAGAAGNAGRLALLIPLR